MSLPVEADFAVVKKGNGASPTEVFTILCGLDNIQINRTANASDRNRRDCAAPGTVPYRRSRTTSKQMDITASGALNIPDIDSYNDSLGVAGNYRIELGVYDGTDAGDIIWQINGRFNLLSASSGVGEDSNAEVTLASDGIWTEAAPT